MDMRRRSAVWWAAMAILFGSMTSLGAGVVINEIAWGGTAAGTSDEWIELHNASDEPVDLTGWVLAFGDTVIHLGAVEGATRVLTRTTIEAGGYFLLERTDDLTVSDVEADILYVGALSNSGALLELRDASGAVVDQVDASETGWPAGTAGGADPPYATMERTDPHAEVAAWATNDGQVQCGLDANGAPLRGTPRAENAAQVAARCAPNVALLAPGEAGEVLSGTALVRWSATDPDGADAGLRITVCLSMDGGDTWETLAENLANGGSYAWDTRQFPDGDAVRIEVVAEDSDGRRGEATSPPFTVRNGTG